MRNRKNTSNQTSSATVNTTSRYIPPDDALVKTLFTLGKSNGWIVNPAYFESAEILKNQVTFCFSSIFISRHLYMYNLTPAYYEAFADRLHNHPIISLGLQNMSLEVVEKVISSLPPTLKMLGVAYLNDESLDLICRTLTLKSSNQITVYCGKGISEEWKTKLGSIPKKKRVRFADEAVSDQPITAWDDLRDLSALNHKHSSPLFTSVTSSPSIYGFTHSAFSPLLFATSHNPPMDSFDLTSEPSSSKKREI